MLAAEGRGAEGLASASGDLVLRGAGTEDAPGRHLEQPTPAHCQRESCPPSLRAQGGGLCGSCRDRRRLLVTTFVHMWCRRKLEGRAWAGAGVAAPEECGAARPRRSSNAPPIKGLHREAAPSFNDLPAEEAVPSKSWRTPSCESWNSPSRATATISPVVDR